jgi:hypothetical protein
VHVKKISAARYQKMNKYLMLSTRQTDRYNILRVEKIQEKSLDINYCLWIHLCCVKGATMGLFSAHFVLFGLLFLHQGFAAPPVEVNALNVTEYREAKGILTKIID